MAYNVIHNHEALSVISRHAMFINALLFSSICCTGSGFSISTDVGAPTISLGGSHQNIGLHTDARANVVLLTYLLAFQQFDGDVKDQLYSWLPRTLGSNVRCVLSMVNGSLAHEALKGRGLKEASLKVLPVLDLEQKMVSHQI